LIYVEKLRISNLNLNESRLIQVFKKFKSHKIEKVIHIKTIFQIKCQNNRETIIEMRYQKFMLLVKVVPHKIQVKVKDVQDQVLLVLEGLLNNKMILWMIWVFHLEKRTIQKIKEVLITMMKPLTLML